ncbi:MAG: hypothetical protein ACFFDK_02620 [Promethearchaeota archaeon]
MNIGEELFILRRSGEVLLQIDINYFEEKESNLLFGSFISAIMDFAQKSFGSGIQDLTLKDKYVSFLIDEEYNVVIALVSQDSKKKHLKKHLKEIHQLFTNSFDKQTIQNFDGDLSIMRDFSEKLKSKYKTKIDDFLENF